MLKRTKPVKFEYALYLERDIPYESRGGVYIGPWNAMILCNRVADVLDDWRGPGIAEIAAQIPLPTR